MGLEECGLGRIQVKSLSEWDMKRILRGWLDIMSRIWDTNDSCMKKCEQRRMKKIAWWSNELERMKKSVIKCRRAF